jgi:hypothetical protein
VPVVDLTIDFQNGLNSGREMSARRGGLFGPSPPQLLALPDGQITP